MSLNETPIILTKQRKTKRKRHKKKRRRVSKKVVKQRRALRASIPFLLYVLFECLSDDLGSILNVIVSITNLNLFDYQQLIKYYSITQHFIKQNKLNSNIIKWNKYVDYRYFRYNIDDIQIKKLMANQDKNERINIANWRDFNEHNQCIIVNDENEETILTETQFCNDIEYMFCENYTEYKHMFRKENSFNILCLSRINLIGLHELCQYLFEDKIPIKSVAIYCLDATKRVYNFCQLSENRDIIRLWMMKNDDYSNILRVTYSKTSKHHINISPDHLDYFDLDYNYDHDFDDSIPNDYFKASCKDIITKDFYTKYVNKCIKCDSELKPIKNFDAEDCVCCGQSEYESVEHGCCNKHIVCHKCHISMNKLIESGFVNVAINNQILLQCKGNIDVVIEIMTFAF